MIKYIRELVVGSICALAFAGAAQAVPMTWVDSKDFNPDIYISDLTGFTYTHSIVGAPNNFQPGVDTVTGYQLALNLYSTDRAAEWAYIDMPGTWGDRIYWDVSGSEFGGWSMQGESILNSTGTLTYTVRALYGDFMLGGSTLTAWGDRGGAVGVPEPATLGLFGLGLIGAAFAARRRQSVGNEV